MLALDSPRWLELTHAYGFAGDIPGQLKAAAKLPPCTTPEDEPYFGLWSALCHQGDVYTASYAAVPHLVEICRENSGHVVASVLDLIAAIEAARLWGRGPDIPDDLSPDYHAAIAALPGAASQLLSAAQNEEECRVVLAALAAVKGYGRLATAITELNPDVTEALLERWLFE